MDRSAIAIATAAIAFLVSLGLTRGAMEVALRKSWLDQVGERRVSTRRLPRIGGVGVAAGTLVALVATFVMPAGRFDVERDRVILLMVASALLFGVMLVDDLRGLGAVQKLVLQVAAAAIVILPRIDSQDRGIVIEQFNAPGFGLISLPVWAAISFSLFWMVGMMNTVNLIDGLDGLAGSLTLVACAILFAHTYFWPRDDPQFTISLIPAALAGATLGFLVYNWHPARIILGDAGAYYVGFTLAVGSIIGGAKIATALLALGLPILDVAWVVVYRLRTGRSPLSADRGHLHHRLLDLGLSQARIVLLVSATSLLFGMSSLLLPSRELKLVAIAAIGVVLLATVMAVAGEEESRGRRLWARFR